MLGRDHQPRPIRMPQAEVLAAAGLLQVEGVALHLKLDDAVAVTALAELQGLPSLTPLGMNDVTLHLLHVALLADVATRGIVGLGGLDLRAVHRTGHHHQRRNKHDQTLESTHDIPPLRLGFIILFSSDHKILSYNYIFVKGF